MSEGNVRILPVVRIERASDDYGWQEMDSAPRDRQILVRRHNDIFYEYYVVWHSSEDEHYPWRNDYTAYPTDRLDGWCEIPGIHARVQAVGE